jgi:hypothetical protein
VFWVISVYFNIRNTLPKFFTFLPGHPVYVITDHCAEMSSYIMCSVPTNALVCNKTLIKMSHIKTLKIIPTCFDHRLIIIREIFDLVKIAG